MSNPPSIYTWVNDENLLASNMRSRVEDVLNFLMNPPMVRLRKTTNQNFTNATFAMVSWDFVEVEVTNMWDSSQPTRIKPSVPGWYIGSCGWSCNGNTTGLREMNVYKNGATNTATDVNMIRNMGQGYANASWTNVSRGNIFLEQFNGTTDYVEMQLFQNSGGTLGMQVNTQESQADFTLRWFALL